MAEASSVTFLRGALIVLTVFVLCLMPHPSFASCTQISNCEDLKCAIGLLDEQIAANANNRDDQQRFQEARNTYSKLYNAQCTGQASSGGGVGGMSGMYGVPSGADKAGAIFGAVGTVLGAIEQQQRQHYNQQQAVRQEMERHREIEQAERARADSHARLQDDHERSFVRNPFASDGGAESDDNPFSTAGTQDEDAQCANKYLNMDRGEGVIPGLPACPTDEEAARYCGVALPPPGSGTMTPACVLQVKEKTFDSAQCRTWKIKNDLAYRNAYSCFQQRLNEQIDAGRN